MTHIRTSSLVLFNIHVNRLWNVLHSYWTGARHILCNLITVIIQHSNDNVLSAFSTK